VVGARLPLNVPALPSRPVRRIAEVLRVAGHELRLHEDEILVGESIPAAVERWQRPSEPAFWAPP
jgi:hypothetical protein